MIKIKKAVIPVAGFSTGFLPATKAMHHQETKDDIKKYLKNLKGI